MIARRRTLVTCLALLLGASLLAAACDLGVDTPNPPVKITATTSSPVAPGTVVTISVDAQAPPNATASAVVRHRGPTLQGQRAHPEQRRLRPDPGRQLHRPPAVGGHRFITSVGVAPPYKTGTLKYKLGAGTDHYTMGDGTAVTITCNKATPCQLVAKVQVPASAAIPSGQVYKHFPVTFSS